MTGVSVVMSGSRVGDTCAIERDFRDSFTAYKVLNGISAGV
jgi:hypothetical protein